MKYHKILFLIIILMTFINVEAVCDSKRLNELTKIAEKIEFNYDYTIEKVNNPSDGRIAKENFKITAINLNKQVRPLIITDYFLDDYREFKFNNSGQSSLSGFNAGERVKITFKAYTTDECSGKTLLTKTISLPYYNWFYNTEECGQYREFKHCNSELVNDIISWDAFNNELEKFINQKNSIQDDDKNDNKDKFDLNQYIGLIIIIFIVILLVILIIIKVKQIRKKKSL